jgi:ABC-type multidrug transport system ATPase subunit
MTDGQYREEEEMEKSGSAVSAHDLAKTFGAHEALGGVSFEVAFGETYAYLGRNGSGKTTTVRLLTGLTAPSRGEAWVAGRDLDHLDAPSIGVTMPSFCRSRCSAPLTYLET